MLIAFTIGWWLRTSTSRPLEGIYMLYVVNGVINTDGSLIRGVERTSLPIIKLIITDRAHGVDWVTVKQDARRSIGMLLLGAGLLSGWLHATRCYRFPARYCLGCMVRLNREMIMDTHRSRLRKNLSCVIEVYPSRPASAGLFSTPMLNLVLTYSLRTSSIRFVGRQV